MRGRVGGFLSFHPLVWFISPSVDTDAVSAWKYLHVSEDFQKRASHSQPSYFAVKFHVSDGFPHTVARRWRYCLTKDILTKNFPEQIYLVMVNRASHKMDIAGFISLVVALAKWHTSSSGEISPSQMCFCFVLLTWGLSVCLMLKVLLPSSVFCC